MVKLNLIEDVTVVLSRNYVSIVTGIARNYWREYLASLVFDYSLANGEMQAKYPESKAYRNTNWNELEYQMFVILFVPFCQFFFFWNKFTLIDIITWNWAFVFPFL